MKKEVFYYSKIAGSLGEIRSAGYLGDNCIGSSIKLSEVETEKLLNDEVISRYELGASYTYCTDLLKLKKHLLEKHCKNAISKINKGKELKSKKHSLNKDLEKSESLIEKSAIVYEINKCDDYFKYAIEDLVRIFAKMVEVDKQESIIIFSDLERDYKNFLKENLITHYDM